MTKRPWLGFFMVPLVVCCLFFVTRAATTAQQSPKTNNQRQPTTTRKHPRRFQAKQKQQQTAPAAVRSPLPNDLPGRILQQDTTIPLDASRDALRKTLLENYERTNFPFEHLWNANTNTTTTSELPPRTGLPVQVSLNFHRVFEVDVSTSTADLVVWVRQSWNDPRLVWDPNATGIETLHFWIAQGSGAGGETSQIWTPDLELWNLEISLQDSLVDTYAVVNWDGTVFWSRPGHVQPVCKFQGLDKFPFDTLTCTLEIGSWSFSGLYLRPQKLGEGYSIGGSETAGESFAEFSLLGVECEELVYPPFPGNQEEDWPVLLYHMTFQRSWEPYARGYLILQIILNLAAFSCFWLPPHVGERMSLAITSLLAAVASQLVVEANLPVASELTWFSTFSIQSLLFTAMALFESAAVIYFHYKTSNDLYPRWYKWIRNKAKGQDGAARRRSSVHFSDHVLTREFAANSAMSDIQEGEEERNGENTTKRDDAASEASEPSESDDRDVSRSSVASSQMSKDYSFRTRQGIKTVLGRDADDFKSYKEMENNVRWQKVATTMDECSRVIFPVAFAISVASMFSRVDF